MELQSLSYFQPSHQEHSALADHYVCCKDLRTNDLAAFGSHFPSIVFPFRANEKAATQLHSRNASFQPDQQIHTASSESFQMRHFQSSSNFPHSLQETQCGTDLNPGRLRQFEESPRLHRPGEDTDYNVYSQLSTLSDHPAAHAWADVSEIERQTSPPFTSQSGAYGPFLTSSGHAPSYCAEAFPECEAKEEMLPPYNHSPLGNPFHTPQFNDHHAMEESLQPSTSFTPNPRGPDGEVELEGINDPRVVGSEDPTVRHGLGDIPYARLIYAALKDAPNHSMVLRDIYRWIEGHTDKANDPSFTGWQNSVRHNLSMNKAFTKVPYTPPNDRSKKGYIWVLEKSAISRGVQPTTRYRKKDENKKVEKGAAYSAQRQRSGRKGGHAARRSARLKDLLDYHESRPEQGHHRCVPYPVLDMVKEPSRSITPCMERAQSPPATYNYPTPPLTALSSLNEQTLCADSVQYLDPKSDRSSFQIWNDPGDHTALLPSIRDL
ncbi:MAG: hypothetical protein Q9217_000053 [Psora testacea]